ncbi:hypothetical protein AVEN_217959-1 [Araneus ventricosus]|uniref:Uncharacterized protein n=1 Tax=Araneus ventricosus TaxID=182803 RepID=A0A4Y2IJQ7_ARAVE|nr:hypothetical protein AVEN_217959-1 [Araneus ventricosus]
MLRGETRSISAVNFKSKSEILCRSKNTLEEIQEANLIKPHRLSHASLTRDSSSDYFFLFLPNHFDRTETPGKKAYKNVPVSLIKRLMGKKNNETRCVLEKANCFRSCLKYRSHPTTAFEVSSAFPEWN